MLLTRRARRAAERVLAANARPLRQLLLATGRDRAVTLLNMDVAPADIIAMITASSFDASAATRQYGVVDLMGRAAGFTGSRAQDYKEDRQGTIGALTYSVQGNILTGKAVIDQAEAAFRNTGCDLADKLMLALEAGAMGGNGDSRCTPQGIPSARVQSASTSLTASERNWNRIPPRISYSLRS